VTSDQGTFDPGDSPSGAAVGAIVIQGDLTLGANSDVRLDVAGNSFGQYDSLAVFGGATWRRAPA
jgi:hypothetical protein